MAFLSRFRHRPSSFALSSTFSPPSSRTFCFTPKLGSEGSSNSNPFADSPSPPRLPKEEQEIFEELQRRSTGAFSTPRATPAVNQSPSSSTAETNSNNATGEEDLLHPDVVRGAKPEFEGDVNPKTGEVGGPKNNPLRWGAQGDWSFNGRVTDF
ncbi:hypothetical protein AJ80_02433 [Polytolypa hystricis UAMH7299]|uniref:Succinate dehydrogenase assembly factor 4, mitochondrial n=1 Tax=Polytolypa hystricis (strain UAMH7299) TaxID=1447883 RepID=A0A2B7YR22_POLH7|nr:hypothetical protein AJ80_02433 [Polytolypa hystricis UAMH7299]